MTDTQNVAPPGSQQGSARLPVRSDLHEELWGVIVEAVYEVVTEFAPTFGKVKGFDGSGNLVVELDTEDEGSRTVGFPKARGVNHKAGDQVLVQRSQAGDLAAVANISSGSGDEAAVGRAQLQGQAVGTNELDNDLASKIANAASQESVQNVKDDLATKAPKDHTHDEYASGGHNHGMNDLPSELATKQWVQDNFVKK